MSNTFRRIVIPAGYTGSTLIINGPGRLEAAYGIHISGINNNLIINSGTVTASGIGISVFGGNLRINGGTVAATGKSVDIYVHICARVEGYDEERWLGLDNHLIRFGCRIPIMF